MLANTVKITVLLLLVSMLETMVNKVTEWLLVMVPKVDTADAMLLQ
jgi:hypothetical protein